jgi:hypothetical protein
MKDRRIRRNDFFHSAQLLDLNITSRMCVEAFCDLFDYCETLFEDDWGVAAAGARNLTTLQALFELDRLTFSNPDVSRKIGEIIEKWPRNATTKRRSGVHIATYPEDLHLRLCVISGGQRLHDQLEALLTEMTT